MHAKPDLRVVIEWTIAGSGSVIAAVIRVNQLGRRVVGESSLCRARGGAVRCAALQQVFKMNPSFLANQRTDWTIIRNQVATAISRQADEAVARMISLD